LWQKLFGTTPAAQAHRRHGEQLQPYCWNKTAKQPVWVVLYAGGHIRKFSEVQATQPEFSQTGKRFL